MFVLFFMDIFSFFVPIHPRRQRTKPLAANRISFRRNHVGHIRRNNFIRFHPTTSSSASNFNHLSVWNLQWLTLLLICGTRFPFFEMSGPSSWHIARPPRQPHQRLDHNDNWQRDVYLAQGEEKNTFSEIMMCKEHRKIYSRYRYIYIVVTHEVHSNSVKINYNCLVLKVNTTLQLNSLVAKSCNIFVLQCGTISLTDLTWSLKVWQTTAPWKDSFEDDEPMDFIWFYR